MCTSIWIQMYFWTLKKVVMNVEQNTKHSERKTQTERQLEKKAHTHDTESKKKANPRGRCVRETEAIIFKTPR